MNNIYAFGEEPQAPPELREKKIRELSVRQMQEADYQDLETIQAFDKEQKVSVYFDRNDETDYVVANADGTVSYIARCVNVNGVQWQIPAEQHTTIPKSVYEILQRSEDIKNRYRPKPLNMVKVDLGYGL